jgi:hypothetical protein
MKTIYIDFHTGLSIWVKIIWIINKDGQKNRWFEYILYEFFILCVIFISFYASSILLLFKDTMLFCFLIAARSFILNNHMI